MNKKIYLLLTVLLAWSFSLKAQTAEIEQVTTGVPGTVESFDLTFADITTNVGAVSLFIGYDPNVLTFVGSTLVDPQFGGYVINNMAASHQVGIQWSNPYGADINGVVLTLQFQYGILGGSCGLIFGPGCEFADILLNSIPVTYTNGSIEAAAGIPTITIDEVNATAGPITTGVGVTGAGFTSNVGAITLYIEFDKTVLQFTGFSTTLTALYVNGNNSTGLIGVTYSNTTGESINTKFLTLNFIYDGTDTSELVFKSGCEIAKPDLSLINVSFDNGFVRPLGTSYKLTIDNAVESPGNVIGIPIKAEGFNPNLMGAITLHIGFNPAHLTFIDVTGGTISGVSANLLSPGLIGVTWSSSSGALIDGYPFLTLNFDYHFGSSSITFEGGCEVADKFLTVFPTTFINGSITPVANGPEARLPFLTGTIGETIDFPVTVKNFTTDIAAISMFIGFDNTVLTYTGNTPVTINGYFINYMGGTSQLGVQWFAWPDVNINPSGTLGDVLFILHFTYNGGECGVTFDAGCEFAYGDLTKAPVAFYDGGVITGSFFNIKTFLEGPYNGATMNTYLNDQDLIPTDQPYSDSYWNYEGTESVTEIPEGVVDWVLLEIREVDGPASAATSATMVAQKAAFILDDGTIVDLDGESEVLFPMAFTDNVYVVVYHRNHVRVMSANALTMVGATYVYNFSDAAAKAYDSQQQALGGGVYGMYAADIENDGEVFAGDVFYLLNAYGVVSGAYDASDLDLDGEVFAGDVFFLLNNYGITTFIP